MVTVKGHGTPSVVNLELLDFHPDSIHTTSLDTNISAMTPSHVMPYHTEQTHVHPHAINLTPVCRYSKDTSKCILSMVTNKKGSSLPFLQRMQLRGLNEYPVRATGQVDDGAMCNCISKD